MSTRAIYLLIFAIYTVLLIYLGFAAQKRGSGTVAGFLMGNRRFGGIATSFSYLATACSASSFLVGGGGFGYMYGWAHLPSHVVNTLAAIVAWGFIAKSIWRASVRTNALSVLDLLKKRYSKAVAIIGGIVIILFFPVYIQGQFTAAARIFEATLGIPAVYGIIIFAIVVGVYTCAGGYTAIVWTDVLQMATMFLMLIYIFPKSLMIGGGISGICQRLGEIDPVLLRAPWMEGVATEMGPWVIMAWFCTFVIGYVGTPQCTQRMMTMESTKIARSSMVLICLGMAIMFFCSDYMGLVARVLFPNLASPDLAVPTLIAEVMNPVIGGTVVVAVVAAMMSTVDSLLIVACSAVAIDVYKNLTEREISEKKMLSFNRWVAAIITVVAALLAIYPLSFIKNMVLWLVSFAWSGTAVAFTFPILFGLYWKRATTQGAVASMILGVLTQILWQVFLTSKTGVQGVVPAFAVSAIVMVLVSHLTPEPSEEVVKTFFADTKEYEEYINSRFSPVN